MKKVSSFSWSPGFRLLFLGLDRLNSNLRYKTVLRQGFNTAEVKDLDWFEVKLFWPIVNQTHRSLPSFWERETKKGRRPGEMTVLLLFQKTAGYNQLPLPRPLNHSRPIGALLSSPLLSSCASAVTPLSEVSYTPFGTAETHQCPSLKQENSLIFGPWLPIHVFLYKSYTMLHLSSEYNSTD